MNSAMDSNELVVHRKFDAVCHKSNQVYKFAKIEEAYLKRHTHNVTARSVQSFSGKHFVSRS